MQQHAMTVDVEDYFQVSAFQKHFPIDSWSEVPLRVDGSTNRVLDMFAKTNTKATFFTLGWVAKRCPQLIRRIAEQGHEIASHGFYHQRVTEMTPIEFRRDIVNTKQCLEDISGYPVIGYRAPSFSFNATTDFAHQILAETGHRYSSSTYPIAHDHYGMPNATRFPYQAAPRLIEVPITTLRVGGKNFPIGGGGYFRLYPYSVSRWALSSFAKRTHQSGVFYFHPWEIDSDQPKVDNLDVKTRFRHYHNLQLMEKKISQLLEDFEWTTMRNCFCTQKDLHHVSSRDTEALPL